MLYMPYSPQFVQEVDKQGPRINPSQANLAWSDISSLKRDSGREHHWISLLARFHLAPGERWSRLSEIISLKRDSGREQPGHHASISLIKTQHLAWSDFSSLKRDLDRMHQERLAPISLPVRSKRNSSCNRIRAMCRFFNGQIRIFKHFA